MKILTLSLTGLASLKFAEASTAAAPVLTVNLRERNGSGESGMATLTQTGSDIRVVISLKGAPPATPQPAHIHNGTCANLKDVVYPLSNLVNGESTTTVRNVTIQKLLAGTYAINIHESATNITKYVACGDIVAKPS